MRCLSKKIFLTIFCGAAIALLGSCRVTEISEQEQSASLAPYSNLEIKGAPLEYFLRERTATLIGSQGLKIRDRVENPDARNSDDFEPTFSLEFAPDKPFSIGTALAIDPRGYFLTAGHCLDGREIYASFVNREKKLVIRRVRPIWVKVSSMTAIDFALFHVEGEPLQTFQWASSFEIGEPVFSAGATFEKRKGEEPPFHFSTEGFAGVIKKSSYERFERKKFQIIQHKSPVRRGNSGGPLTNQQGGLIGINYSAATPIQRAAGAETIPASFAIRPDQGWVRNLIEEDWAKLQAR